MVQKKESRKHLRGFASLSVERKKEISSMGGKAAHKLGVAHEWTSEEAREAGRKGGLVSRGGKGKSNAALEIELSATLQELRDEA